MSRNDKNAQPIDWTGSIGPAFKLLSGCREVPVEQNSNVRDWVALSLVPGIGRRTAVLLADRFESPASCFEVSTAELESAGLKRESIEALRSGESRAVADRELEALGRLGGKVLALSDPDYPVLLRETFDPPVVVYYLGDLLAALARPAVAIVGSRRCSTYGRNASEMLGRELAQRGITVVSGLARGIDAFAHRGALDGGGLTIAVMGTGLDSVYPKENRKLAEAIAKQGALLTEFPLGTPPLSQNFPFRNRVLSGLSLGVVVVEAAERSGSLITARMAYEQGRDVFAIPGNITSAKSFGPNYLIKDGAKLVQTWQDVVEEFPLEIRARILSGEKNGHREEQTIIEEAVLSDVERKLLGMIKPDEAIHIDQLIQTAKLTTSELMGALLKLEMMDRIRQLPGKTFVRKL